MGSLTACRKEILETIKSNPGITQSELSKTVEAAHSGKVKANSVSAYISQLAIHERVMQRLRTRANNTFGGVTFKLYPLGHPLTVTDPKQMQALRKGAKDEQKRTRAQQAEIDWKPPEHALPSPAKETFATLPTPNVEEEVGGWPLSRARAVYAVLKKIFD